MYKMKIKKFNLSKLIKKEKNHNNWCIHNAFSSMWYNDERKEIKNDKELKMI